MSLSAAALIAVLVVAVAPIVRVLVRRAREAHAQCDRILAESCPPSVLAEVDDLELLYSLPAYDPAWDAGCERLWDAVRDEQNHQKGDQ